MSRFRQRRAALIHQCRVKRVETGIDPVALRLAAGLTEGRVCSMPYLRMTTSQPKARKIASIFSQNPSRMTASRLWQL